MKVLLGLSGGVDSAVAAYLLKKEGYEVTGCFMRNWDSLAENDYLGNPNVNNDQCPQEKDYDDAKKVCEKLDIPLLRVDFVKEYWDKVFSDLIDEYNKGRTPNPDIFCNKYIKFDAFLEYALTNGFDAIAMGHYAKRVDQDGVSYLLKSDDRNKDQSYFLAQISQAQLSSCLFPLGSITKVEVREIAKQLGLEVYNKKGSTGICFIGERHFKEFLNNYIPMKKGPIIDIDTGKYLKNHDGVMFYTIGQRKGLGIGGIANQESDSYFVADKDVKNNILYVAKGSANPYLYSTSCTLDKINYISRNIKEGETLSCKFRYRQADQEVVVHLEEDATKIRLEFKKPYKAVVPGQSAVLYDGDICLGGGIIDIVTPLKDRD
ncbi:MAG: tRNA 2-thiouridine(34) synthase MnmA [Coprobacillus sp.]|nr:tRNA 2-thiouridine(34) synthase MnmA [Coprobacillus sp.]